MRAPSGAWRRGAEKGPGEERGGPRGAAPPTATRGRARCPAQASLLPISGTQSSGRAAPGGPGVAHLRRCSTTQAGSPGGRSTGQDTGLPQSPRINPGQAPALFKPGQHPELTVSYKTAFLGLPHRRKPDPLAFSSGTPPFRTAWKRTPSRVPRGGGPENPSGRHPRPPPTALLLPDGKETHGRVFKARNKV